MRKYVSLLLCFVLLLALAAPAAAASNGYSTYNVKDLGFCINMPDSYDPITLNTPVNDPVFHKHQRDGGKMLEWMSKNNILMNALCTDGTSEILISVDEGDFGKDFIGVDEDYLQKTAEYNAENWTGEGLEMLDCGYFMSSQLNYVKLIYKQAKSASYSVLYYSVVDGDRLNVQMTFKNEPTEDQQEMSQYIADSFAVENLPIYFGDVEGGTYMTAPEGSWIASEMVDGKEVQQAFFLPGGSFAFMTYNSEAAEGAPDMDDLSSDDIAQLLGVDASKLEEAEYAGIKYIVGTLQQNITYRGTAMTVDVYNFMTIQNEHIYHIQYVENQKDNGAARPAFEALMDSMEYGVDFD